MRWTDECERAVRRVGASWPQDLRDDLRQDARLDLLKAPDPDPRAHEKEREAYLLTIARHAMRKALRQTLVRRMARVPEHATRTHDWSAIDARLDVDAALKRLPAKLRYYYRCRYLAGLSASESARRVSVDPKTISNRERARATGSHR